jgi:hypothetical protein
MIDKRMPLPLDVANDYATPSGKDASIKVKLERGDRKLLWYPSFGTKVRVFTTITSLLS